MSLDTATKRRSMLAMGVLAIVVHPVPDASIDAIDRKHFLGLMAAIATAMIAASMNGKLSSTPMLTGLLNTGQKLSGRIHSAPDAHGKLESH